MLKNPKYFSGGTSAWLARLNWGLSLPGHATSEFAHFYLYF
jgi:hypothetical protein